MAIDLDYLLRLRLVVARYGEMDVAGWWNTKQLGRTGATVLRRGFPRTHRFAQARSVFAVAADRSAEVLDPPGSVTLWSMPAPLEAAFDGRWEHWLGEAAEWEPVFRALEEPGGRPILDLLGEVARLPPQVSAELPSLRRSAEGRAVVLPGLFEESDECIGLLALGYARAQKSEPLVPYARLAS